MRFVGGTWFSLYFHSVLPSFPSWFLRSPLSSFPPRGKSHGEKNVLMAQGKTNSRNRDTHAWAGWSAYSLYKIARTASYKRHASRRGTHKRMPRSRYLDREKAREKRVAWESPVTILENLYRLTSTRSEKQGPDTPLRRFDPLTASSRSIYYETPAASRDDALSIRRETGLRPARNRAYNSANFTARSLYSSTLLLPASSLQRSDLCGSDSPIFRASPARARSE